MVILSLSALSCNVYPLALPCLVGLLNGHISSFLHGHLCSAFKESLQVEKKYSKEVEILSAK